jgi:cysteine desulfurase / selenocysteine lyase
MCRCHPPPVTLCAHSLLIAARASLCLLFLSSQQQGVVPTEVADLQALGADWIVASGHKMCAPTGVGFLWGRYDLLESMAPWQCGGEMIADVFLDHSTYAPPPGRFEAGTPAIAEVVGMGAAVDYLESIGGMAAVHAHEAELGAYLYERLSAVEDISIYGPPLSCPMGRAGLAAFNIKGLHATDVSMLLDTAGASLFKSLHCIQGSWRCASACGML